MAVTVPTIRLYISGGVLEEIVNVDGSVEYLEIEIVDADENEVSGLPADEVTVTEVIKR